MPHTYHAADGLQVEIHADEEAMSARAAGLVAEALRLDPSLLLCAATGATPTRTYAHLADLRRQEPTLFERLRVLKLDEWGGFGAEAPGSCEHYLRRHVLDPLGVSESRYFGFRGDAPEPQAACERFRRILAAEGPIGLCVLGLGLNGHLGFIEPADVLLPHAHVATLDARTQQHPMLREGTNPPRWGLTLGMADILQAQRVLLLVSGTHKRAILGRLLSEGISTRLPGSFLQLHSDAVVLADRAAGGMTSV